jgi:hypothetical protein
MKHWLKLITVLGILTGMLLGSGCATLHEEEEKQQVPWSRPADWEGTMPGMPTQRG